MHIIVADPDRSMSRYLDAVMTEAGHAVTVAASGLEVVRAALVARADAIILEPTLPDISGVVLCQTLRAHTYAGPIIVISHSDDIDAKVSAFRAGADDYLVKPFDPRELLVRLDVRIEQARRGMLGSEQAVLTAGAARLSLAELTYHVHGREPVHLTPIETRMLRVLMSHPGQAVSRDELLSDVWGVALEHDTNRLDVYIRRLRQKIEFRPEQPAFLRTVWRIGYMFVPPATQRP